MASKTITPTYLKPINTAEDLLMSDLTTLCTPGGCNYLYNKTFFKQMKDRIDPGLLDALFENIDKYYSMPRNVIHLAIHNYFAGPSTEKL